MNYGGYHAGVCVCAVQSFWLWRWRDQPISLPASPPPLHSPLMAGFGDSSWKAHAALVLVQMNYGGYHVITKLALSVGINQLVFSVLRDLLALSVLAPVAYVKEKRVRPPLNCQLIFSFFFLGLTGIFANQLLFLLGLSLTSPTYAAALQPAIPVFAFVLALLMGTEVINWNGRDGKAKVLGTLVCVFGAIVMTLYKGPLVLGDSFYDMQMQGAMSGKPSPKPIGWLAEGLLELGLEMWHIGMLCLIGNCLSMALYIVFQVPLLAKYPAELSLTAYSYAFGTCLMALCGPFAAQDASDWVLTRSEIFSVAYAGLVASALNYALLTWSNKVLGPTLVALYIPLQPVASSAFSWLFLGSCVYFGSILGGGLMIVGLYIVTWGRREAERIAAADPHRRLFQDIQYHNGSLNMSVNDQLLNGLYQRAHAHPVGFSNVNWKVDKL
eukprot:c26126_g1_i1 orf=2-1321(+)